MIFKTVIFAQIISMKDFIDGLASLAAEIFLFKNNMVISACFPAVIAFYGFMAFYQQPNPPFLFGIFEYKINHLAKMDRQGLALLPRPPPLGIGDAVEAAGTQTKETFFTQGSLLSVLCQNGPGLRL
jgi:hypothetical protein